MGSHVVDVRLVAASRGPVSEDGQLASSKDVQRRFFLMRRSSIEGSPARLRTFMFVTLSCHPIFMIDRRCLIMKACNIFTCIIYTVHVSVPYSKVDSMIARYIIPFTFIDTLWLFQSLSRRRPNDILVFEILFGRSASI